MPSIAFKTLGCRLNQHETDALVTAFSENQFQVVDFKENADVTIINTCTVTGMSDHKSRYAIQQAIKANPGKMVVVTGCMVSQFKTEIEQIPGVSLVVDNSEKNTLPARIRQLMNSTPTLSTKPDVFGYRVVNQSLHTRAAIKIQDGCDNFCTFCIIPAVRGRAVSKPPKDILEQIKQTVDNGFKEVVVTGVNIGRYSHSGMNFTGLLQEIISLPGDFRVRVTSLEPDGFGPGLADLFTSPRLTPHLHLCLQSGSDQVLLRMRRMYNTSQYIETIQEFRQRFPLFNFTTDVIVGFPGESDDQFMQTLALIEQAGFSHIHTLKYSSRNGTPASRMTDKVSEKIKNERSEQVRLLSEKLRNRYLANFIGKSQKVLLEKHLGANRWFGYGEHYIPVIVEHPRAVKNQWLNVRITGFDNQYPDNLSAIAEANYTSVLNKSSNIFHS